MLEAALLLLLAALSLVTAMEGEHGRPVLLGIAMDNQMDNPWKLVLLLLNKLQLLLEIQGELLYWVLLLEVLGLVQVVLVGPEEAMVLVL